MPTNTTPRETATGRETTLAAELEAAVRRTRDAYERRVALSRTEPPTPHDDALPPTLRSPR